jgi:hypothetical protein
LCRTTKIAELQFCVVRQINSYRTTKFLRFVRHTRGMSLDAKVVPRLHTIPPCWRACSLFHVQLIANGLHTQ